VNFLLELHSILRWAIVVLSIFTILKFALGLLRKRGFGKMDRGLSAGFSGLMDLQVMLGFLYFFITGFGGAGFPMFRIEHLTTMLLAAVAGHAPAIFKKTGWNKYALGLGAIIVAMLLVYVGVMRLPGGWSR